MWKRGRNLSFNMDRIQEAVEIAVQIFIIRNLLSNIFTRRKIRGNKNNETGRTGAAFFIFIISG